MSAQHTPALDSHADKIAEIHRLRDIIAALQTVLEEAERQIEKHGFGGTDQNPFGIRDIIGSAIIAAKGVKT